MDKYNIFSILNKYSSAEENYLTESFVYLINELLLRDRTLGIGLLNNLCVSKNEFHFDHEEKISISTQITTEQGRPDIRISSSDKLIFVEVKHDSPLGHEQISRYKKALEVSSAPIKKVILLTRFNAELNEKEKPYKHMKWFEIYNYLSNSLKLVHDPVCSYLVDSFMSFLEAKQMTLQKITIEYVNGIPALLNLINMIEVAVQAAGIDFYKTYPKSAGWDFKGFNLHKHLYWCGIYFNNPLVITFEVLNKNKYDKTKLPHPTYLLQEGKERLWFRLPLEDIQFFSLDKDKQLVRLTQFISTCFKEAELMKF